MFDTLCCQININEETMFILNVCCLVLSAELMLYLCAVSVVSLCNFMLPIDVSLCAPYLLVQVRLIKMLRPAEICAADQCYGRGAPRRELLPGARSAKFWGDIYIYPLILREKLHSAAEPAENPPPAPRPLCDTV